MSIWRIAGIAAAAVPGVVAGAAVVDGILDLVRDDAPEEAGGLDRDLLSWLPHVLRAPIGFTQAIAGAGVREVADIFNGEQRYEVPANDAARSAAAGEALTRNFGVLGDSGLYYEHANAVVKTATVWPLGQALGAELNRAALTGDYSRSNAIMRQLSAYEANGAYAPSMLGSPFGGTLWDDNAWIGLDFMQAYDQTGNQEYLDAAKRLVPFMLEGLDADGGVRWEEGADHPTRNTCSAAPTMQFFLRLYAATGDTKYRDVAARIEKYLSSVLRREDGLYVDHQKEDGSLDTALYSYNQGTPIGADVQWYEITGDEKYLRRAQETAAAAMKWLGTGQTLWNQPPAFNAIFFRNLMKLDQVAPNPEYRAMLEKYVDRLWTDAYDESTGTFIHNGVGKYGDGDSASLVDHGGVVQMQTLLEMTPQQIHDLA